MPQPAPAVIVVGSYVQDLTWRCATFPTAGQTILGCFATGPGGKGSNQAVAAGRVGADTLFVGAVGADAFAGVAAGFYAENKIAARFIPKPKLATGTAAILVDDAGQNEIVVALGANAALAPRDLPPALFRGARVVVTQLETGLAAVAHTLRCGRRAGATTVLNPAPMRADFDPALLAHVDILIPNETEFVALVNQLGLAPGKRAYTEAALAAEAPAALHALCRRLGPPTVIVTLGKRGCFVSPAEGECALIPAHVVKAVDTTGAGDAFVGGFAAGYVRHDGDVFAAARHGQAVAALSVTKPGTAPSMPTARELAAFLKRVR
ncbi:MAG: ribokinase [Opitutaceae bacterium]|nr:ribokinase [Opitutaceae bacterium]